MADDKKANQEESVKSVSDSTFSKEVLKSDKTVLVDFWAPWCGPCRMQGPIVEEVSNELKGKAKVVKLNTDENQKTAAAYNITGIPALIIFKNGKVVEQKVGLTKKDELLGTINKHL
ncbi:MAG: thioredoxin [Candidatus Melainabacteria bacterium]|nr:thioredoxin [Candidatus Melainabacteria bacterium]